MRSTRLAVLFCSVSILDAPLTAQQATTDQPSFRSGVELVTVEVGVIDRQGRPLRGLAPADFTVTVDGRPRRVVTAEFIDTGAVAQSPARPDEVPVSTNEGAGVGRLFVFVLDGNTLEMGDARQVAAAASRFFSELRAADRSALVSLPVGRSMSFTWAHDQVREALLRSAASGSAATSWEFGSLTEARDIATRGEFALREVALRECSGSMVAGGGFGMDPSGISSSSRGQSPAPSGGSPSGERGGSSTGSSGGQPSAGPPPAGPGELGTDRCLRQIQTQAEMAWAMARANSLSSLTALRQVLASLGRVPSDKTVVLISGGWPLDDGDQASLLRTLAADAAAARATVFSVYVPHQPMSASRRSVSPTLRSDQNLYLWPLENLASMTGGRSFRADAGAEGIFDRLARELAGYYRLGVEKNSADVGASGRRMKVSVKPGGVTVRAREIFDVATYEDRDWSARLAAALEAPVPATAVGLRVTSYLAADPEDSSRVRLVLAGGASRLQPGDAVLQLVVRDLEGRRIVAGEQRLGALAGSAAPFATNVRVPPGSYVVRLAVQDGSGRVGSVDHRVDARPARLGSVSVTGPMLVQVSAGGRGEPHFTLDGVQPDERLALEVGVQGDAGHLAGTDATFEIAASADGPALIQQPASLAPGGRDSAVLAQAVADVRVLPPGRYLVRVKVRSGTEPLGEVRRAFAILERPARALAEPAAAAPAVAPAVARPPESVRWRAATAVSPFAIAHVLSPQLLAAFLDRVAARPDAAAPAASELLARARQGSVFELKVSDAQAAQTPVAAFIQGLTLLAQNKFNPASSAFRAAMRASPDFYPAMVYLGACFAAAGNDKEAAAIWRTALIKEGDLPDLHLLLTDALLRQRSGDVALQVIEAARTRWPDDDRLKRRFVLAALVGGNPAAGLQALDELVDRRAEEEPALALAILVLYESLTQGRIIESADQDRARMRRLADAYRARGGQSLALVETWLAAVRDR